MRAPEPGRWYRLTRDVAPEERRLYHGFPELAAATVPAGTEVRTQDARVVLPDGEDGRRLAHCVTELGVPFLLPIDALEESDRGRLPDGSRCPECGGSSEQVVAAAGTFLVMACPTCAPERRAEQESRLRS